VVLTSAVIIVVAVVIAAVVVVVVVIGGRVLYSTVREVHVMSMLRWYKRFDEELVTIINRLLTGHTDQSSLCEDNHFTKVYIFKVFVKSLV
jgi:hypothetical protein